MTVAVTPSSLLIFMFTVSDLSFYQQTTFYIRWFLYAILVPASHWHSLGLPLPRLEHLLSCLASPSKLTVSASIKMPRLETTAWTAANEKFGIWTCSEYVKTALVQTPAHRRRWCDELSCVTSVMWIGHYYYSERVHFPNFPSATVWRSRSMSSRLTTFKMYFCMLAS